MPKYKIDKIPIEFLHSDLINLINDRHLETVKASLRYIKISNVLYQQLNISIRDRSELLNIINWLLLRGVKACIQNIPTIQNEINYLISLKEEAH